MLVLTLEISAASCSVLDVPGGVRSIFVDCILVLPHAELALPLGRLARTQLVDLKYYAIFEVG